MGVPFYSSHSLTLKLPNKGIDFLFSPLKLLNKGREEYYKIIFFIPFHSLISNEGLVLSMGLTIFNLFTKKKKKFSNVTLKLKTVMDEFSKYMF